jgi:hypothetical protein
MKRETSFNRTLFPAHVVREAFETLFPKESIEKGVQHLLSLQISKDRWTYDSFEQFLADYPRQTGYAYADLHDKERQLVISIHNNDTRIQVKASTHGPINATFEVFERKANSFKLPPPPEPAEAGKATSDRFCRPWSKCSVARSQRPPRRKARLSCRSV